MKVIPTLAEAIFRGYRDSGYPCDRRSRAFVCSRFLQADQQKCFCPAFGRADCTAGKIDQDRDDEESETKTVNRPRKRGSSRICGDPRVLRRRRRLLWIAIAAIVPLLLFPYYINWFI
jgi:hypothetical protein